MINLDTTSLLFFVCLIVCFSFYDYIFFYLNVQYLAGRSFYREVSSVFVFVLFVFCNFFCSSIEKKKKKKRLHVI